MKIGSYDTTPAATANATNAAAGDRKAAAPQARPADAAEPSAKVQLSSAAKAASEGGDAAFDAAKVDRISKAIREGSFQVNAEAIADKLIANAQEVLGRNTA